MDLNQLPPEACHLSADDYRDLSPLFCMQLFETSTSHGGMSFTDFGCPNLPTASDRHIPQQDATIDMPNPTSDGVDTTPPGSGGGATLIGPGGVEGATIADGHADQRHGDGDAEISLQYLAAMSSPDDPYVGKTFGMFEEARLFYKEDAKKLGFEIRNATSCRSAKTQEVDKDLLVCNKEGKGKKSKGEGEETIEPDGPEHINSSDSGSNVPEGAA